MFQKFPIGFYDNFWQAFSSEAINRSWKEEKYLVE